MSNSNPPGLGFDDRSPHFAGATAATALRATSEPAPAIIRRPFQPDLELVQLGVRLADQVVDSRSWERLRPYFADANAKDEAMRRNGVAVLLGVAMRTAATLGAIKERGLVKFTGRELLTQEDVLYNFKTDQNRFIVALNEITETLARTLKAAPSLKIEKRAAEQAEEKPLQVQIVGLPARETAIKVKRDERGDITGSLQLEQDVAK